MFKRSREYRLSLLLLAGSGLLAVILLWQWAHYRGRETDLKSRLAEKVVVHLETPGGEEDLYDLPALEEYSTMVERPLFMEGRRPAAEDAPETIVAEKTPMTMKLMGVVVAPGGPLGLFVDDKGKYKRLRINDSISGWKLAEIEADKAIMEQDGEREELKLVRPKSKKMPTPPVPHAQVPGQQVPPVEANIPNDQEGSADSEQPNDTVDETAAPTEEITNEQ